MKTAKQDKFWKWPMIRVKPCDPKKPQEIISMDEAVARFGLDDRDQAGLTQGTLVGTSVNTSPEAGSVDMVYRYTLEDSVRDAAQDLLKALKDLLHETGAGHKPCGVEFVTAARAAIKKAEREDHV